jgi:hypothetical protein
MMAAGSPGVIDVVWEISEQADIVFAPRKGWPASVSECNRIICASSCEGRADGDWSIGAWVNDPNVGRLGKGTIYSL